MVRQKYKDYARPLARVVHGIPITWEPAVSAVHRNGLTGAVAWSPCNRFIAVTIRGAVEIRDAVTLNLLSTFESPSHTTRHLLFFSPDGRILTQLNSQGLLTLDLQTGGSVHTILPDALGLGHPSPNHPYSMNGKIVTVLSLDNYDTIIATHDLSTSQTHHHRISEGRIIPPTWTHGEFLRFATIKTGSIAIWEVEPTFARAPEMVDSFPLPDEIANLKAFEYFESSLFLPTLRLAVSIQSERMLLIWDARGSKFLLQHPSPPAQLMTFSSDGRFFACVCSGTFGVWKEESPAGYILHQQLSFPPHVLYGGPLFSPNGESLVISVKSTIYLLHTGDPILSGGSTPNPNGFISAFSPNETSVAFARRTENTITIIDLQSGGPQLTIDAGVRIRGLRVTGSIIAVVDLEKIVSWNLAGESGGANIIDSVRTTPFGSSPLSSGGTLQNTLLSPDLSNVITLGWTCTDEQALEYHDALSGRYFASTTIGYTNTSLEDLWFTTDGREIWVGLDEDGFTDGWGIIVDSESGATKLQPLGKTQCPLGALSWLSHRGYEVKDDGWILSPTQKRLLWLPHRWRPGERSRTWSGRFLALGHHELPEVVILEFFE